MDHRNQDRWDKHRRSMIVPLRDGFIHRFWVGHGFSRAAQALKKCGLQPLREAPPERKRVYETGSKRYPSQRRAEILA
jgi:hypothetical protein